METRDELSTNLYLQSKICLDASQYLKNKHLKLNPFSSKDLEKEYLVYAQLL